MYTDVIKLIVTSIMILVALHWYDLLTRALMGLVFSRFTIPRNLGFSEPRKTHFSNSYQIIILSNTSILLIKEYHGQSIILTIQYLLILGNGTVVGECKVENNKIGKNFNV